MERTIYRVIRATPQLWVAAGWLALVLLGGFSAFVYLEHHGHIATGMTNQVVWGLPHVFAIFLIVAASGALNVASMASVFNRAAYKPLARLSGVVALSLLAGGLAVLVLDLGRADRLIVAMTRYNFTSIFAWNIFLYTGFMLIVGAYLYVQMARNLPAGAKRGVGLVAFLWRLALTTGTGSIFGWLVARPGYDAAIMAPLFIAMSFSFGLAVFVLVLGGLCRLSGRPLGGALVTRMGRLLGIFAALVLYFAIVQHMTNLYAARRGGFEHFILFSGNLYSQLFWFGQVLLGGLVPIALVYHPTVGRTVQGTYAASALVILGGFAQLYVIVVGGQAYPMDIYPGFEVVASSFGDGQVASYVPRWPEWLLGLGGVALALMLIGLGAKVLRILPTNLSDANVAAQD